MKGVSVRTIESIMYAVEHPVFSPTHYLTTTQFHTCKYDYKGAYTSDFQDPANLETRCREM